MIWEPAFDVNLRRVHREAAGVSKDIFLNWVNLIFKFLAGMYESYLFVFRLFDSYLFKHVLLIILFCCLVLGSIVVIYVLFILDEELKILWVGSGEGPGMTWRKRRI